MLVADTSAWIEYLRGTGSAVHLALRASVEAGTVTLIEPVKAELLVGARTNAELRELRRLTDGLGAELMHPRDDFDRAVDIHLRCRSVGVTPRGLFDCLIAAITQRCGLPLLHADRDLAAIAAVAGIEEAL
ncbi:MAG: PIN domain-containing protein [Actinobacteria bacterium]|nr:PIN domain-containing protein [Actinomycetota bacterium]